ncbi:N-6 DNA methylase [Lentimicrobium sp. L6]|uniref:class I SAM-dependent DNA methyltransferase n=1 Tax=Lentimicrobium sp. L6 TaxID=2735916 RepID=UPI00155719CE|nr:N-6 DNA methylase [Lentimicrobium sp. L6]NPD86397.1 N-6 DNA methylase [Lentimicrobium sp. L6]
MLNKELQTKVQNLWDKFWSGGITNPLNAIEQITYLLFMKQLDELELKRTKIANSGLSDEKFESIFDGKFMPPAAKSEKDAVEKESLRWGNFKRMPADDMLAHIQTLVFPFIKTLGGAQSDFTKHMSNAVFIIPKSSLLVEAVKAIDEIYDELKSANRYIDAQGDFYEYLLKQLSGAGKNGQFRTPTHIIEMIVELVQPKLGQRIADPACGSAGFLLGAYKYIITQYSSDKEKDENGFLRGSNADKLTDKKLRKTLENETFYGFDIDPTMIRIGLMNLMMHGIKQPKIDYTDTLSKRYNEDGVYDIILANPPFTGSVDKGDINETFELNTTKSELLFLERMYKMLRIGGTAGVVVPQGVLFSNGKAFKQIRQLLIERCELKAVISMPSGFFKPYTGVSTAILIFTKGGETENVWFYNMKSDGLSLDDKRKELLDKEGIRDFGDLHEVIKMYHNSDKQTERNKHHFIVPKNDIISNDYNLSFNKYFEEVYEEIKYDSPQDILSRIVSIEEIISIEIKELTKILNEHE